MRLAWALVAVGSALTVACGDADPVPSPPAAPRDNRGLTRGERNALAEIAKAIRDGRSPATLPNATQDAVRQLKEPWDGKLLFMAAEAAASSERMAKAAGATPGRQYVPSVPAMELADYFEAGDLEEAKRAWEGESGGASR
jgi:hypothetical protein